MTDPTPTEPTSSDTPKVVRARARTSDVPKRAPRKAATPAAGALEPAVPAAETGVTVEIREAVEPATSLAAVPAVFAAPAPAPSVQGTVRAERVEIRQGGADHVEADRVSVTQGGITSVDAREVDVRLGGIAYAHADRVSVTAGGVALARADHVSVERGTVGAAFAREASLKQAYARTVLAGEVRVDQGLAGTVLTGRATFDRPSGVLLLIAGRVEGPVKALLDWRAALAFGAAFGLAWGIARRR